ncbi:MAG: hypothetical protein GXP36_13590 [Actinobacteria bacterium]|nr:hypothetical protein [Actinomycetota bacterium]
MPTFAVDDGFAYTVPEEIPNVVVGSHVTVPLGGRKVKGWVTSVRSGESKRKLKSVVGVSGDLPHFDEALLETLRWVALRYVAPMSTVLARSGPPNISRLKGPVVPVAATETRQRAATCIVTGEPYGPTLSKIVTSVVDSGANVLVVCPTADEVTQYAGILEDALGQTVLRVGSAIPARTVTDAWTVAATTQGNIIVGTREAVLWPLGNLGGVIVVEEGRRGMTSPQTPTWTVRDVVVQRSNVEHLQTWFIGPVPSVQLLATTPVVVGADKRAWPLVEVVNRYDEPPGTGPVLAATVMAIRTTLKRGGSVFVFVNRRAYAPVFRCLTCKELRRCPACGAGAERGDRCPRCDMELGGCAACGARRFEPVGAGIGRTIEILHRSLGDAVGAAGSNRAVVVGTERDIPPPASVDLVVIIDADGMLLAPHYRAEEEAIRILGRAAASVARGTGNRTLIQTNQPKDRVIVALRSGRPVPLLSDIHNEREAAGFPPFGEVIIIKTSATSPDVEKQLQVLGEKSGATVLGPVPVADGHRWLVQGRDLHKFRLGLRSVVGVWRESGVKVRVDVDPIDL